MSRSSAAARRWVRAATIAALAVAATGTTFAQSAGAAPAGYGYDLTATPSIKALVKSGTAITGTATARTDPATGAFAADLAFGAWPTTLVSGSGLPVTATLQVTPAASLAGTIGAGGLTATLKARIRIVAVSVSGRPIALTSNCQFAQLSVITFRSISGTFDPAVGGTLAGSFPTSDLSGCTALNGIVSPATSSNDNAITLRLGAAQAHAATYADQVFPATTLTDGIQYSAPVGPNTTTPQPQLMDLYEPAGDTRTLRPAIVWVHGGSFIAGDRKEGLVSELARRFARRGYVTVSIDYRLLATKACGGANYDTECAAAGAYAGRDADAAVKYLRTHATDLRIDPNRIAIGGDSAGAIAGILVGGPHGAAADAGRVAGVYSISGGSPTDAVFQTSSAPVYFWHGTADSVVPYSWAVANNQTLAGLGVYTVLHSVAGAGHVPVSYIDDMDTNARDFFYRVMSLQTAQQ